MTEAQVQELMKNSADRGHALDHYEASVYLGARETLAKDPANEAAQRVVEDYSKYVIDGTRVTSVAEFLLEIPMTDEEKQVFIDYAAAQESGCRNEGDRPVLSQMPSVSKVLEPSGI